MARLNARWENFTRRGQTWDGFDQDGPAAAATITSSATFAQAAATWAATSAETLAATATFAQAAATWSASAAELLDAAATFAQSASWAATSAETFAATGAWAQDATWSAQGGLAVTSTATFAQSATWAASSVPPVTSTATFDQAAATFDASLALAAAATGNTGGSFIVGPAVAGRLEPVERVLIDASARFAQGNTWAARMNTYDDDAVLELLEMAA